MQIEQKLYNNICMYNKQAEIQWSVSMSQNF